MAQGPATNPSALPPTARIPLCLPTGVSATVRWDSLLAFILAGSSGPTGSGTTNKVAKWTSSSALGDSGITDDGANITTTLPTAIKGTITNDAASSGQVGEYIESSLDASSSLLFSSATTINIDTLSLTAGDWIVEAVLNFRLNAATVTQLTAGITTTSATMPSNGSECNSGLQTVLTSTNDGITIVRKRISLASTTNVYLVGNATFSAGIVGGYGTINGTRIR